MKTPLRRHITRTLIALGAALAIVACYPYSEAASDWIIGPGVCRPKRNLNAYIYPASLPPSTYWPHGTIKDAAGARVQASFTVAETFPCHYENTSEGTILFVQTVWTGTNEASCCRGPIDGPVYAGFRTSR